MAVTTKLNLNKPAAGSADWNVPLDANADILDDSVLTGQEITGDVQLTGAMGINTASPEESLHVVGSGVITGRLGVGTTSPAEQLHVKGSSGEFVALLQSPESEGCLLQWQGDGSGTPYFAGRIDASDEDRFSIGRRFLGEDITLLNDGKVGVGTVAPVGDLHIRNTTGIVTLVVESDDFEANLRVDSGLTSAHASDLEFFDRGVQKWLLRKNASNNIQLIDTTTGNEAPLLVEAGAITNTFVIASGSNVGLNTASPTERLHVVGSGIFEGRLGVGTTSPSQTIHAKGTASTTIKVESDDFEANIAIDSGLAGANTSDLEFYDRGVSKWILRKDVTNTLQFINTGTGNTIPIRVEEGAQNNTLVIDSTSAVGLNTASPTERLHVVGSGILSGDLTVQGTTINLANLPTSSGALNSGDLWIDLGDNFALRVTP